MVSNKQLMDMREQLKLEVDSICRLTDEKVTKIADKMWLEGTREELICVLIKFKVDEILSPPPMRHSTARKPTKILSDVEHQAHMEEQASKE
jgi:hypothetical protein